MRIRFLYILILLIAFIQLYGVERAVIRIPHPTQDMVDAYNADGYDIAAYFPGRWLDLVIPVAQISRMRALHPNLSITQTEADMQTNLHSQDRAIPGYRSYQTLMTDLNTLVAAHSDIMTMSTIGSTWGSQYNALGYSNYAAYNHNIVAVKISDNPTLEEDEPCILYVGAHHAREPLGVETTMAIMQDIVDNYDTDPLITDMVNNCAIWIVPMLNADGHKIVWDNIDSWWRKNLRDNNGNHQFDTDDYYGSGPDGVDLNRNYGYGWGYMSATDYPSDVVYHGPSEFSEPETSALKTLIEAHPFVAGISFHTYSELVLYPYGYVGNINAPDVQELQALANLMAAVIPAEGGGTYTPEPSFALYAASGGLDDWAYGTRGMFNYTIEMGTTFIPGASTVTTIKNRMKAPARKMMERMTKSILMGHVTDSETGAPVQAIIYVQGIDGSPVRREPYMSKLPWGAYYRLLPQGEYTVSFIAPGYMQGLAQVTISPTVITTCDIQLVAGAVRNLTGQVQTFGEIPVADALIEFIATDITPQHTDAQGNFVINDFRCGYYNIRVSKPGFETILLSQNVEGPSLLFLLSDSANLSYDFETNLSGWTTTGTWNVTPQQSHSGSKSLTDSPNMDYADYLDTHAQLNTPLNLTNMVNASLQFYAKADIALDGDYCSLEYSLNGNNWTTMDFFTGAFDWTEKTYNLNGMLGQSIYIRFRMVTNDYGNAPGIYIDNLRFFGSGMIVPNTDNVTAPPITDLVISPNPFKLQTRIDFNLNAKEAARIELNIYNLKGQKVTTLLNNSLTKGAHSTQWYGCDKNNQSVGSGIYFAVMQVNGKPVKSQKLLLLK